ncbi:MAG: hypothetical protein B6D72_08130 [gamma proteobacterium symbiont of Ctena orbiculata]|uniref:DUF1826 domain-containing protein n=1 Tax=Candidatus Thiodiazotropha taylori TaxID=2792791 RepID=A0A944M884_9GAMM|nr:DUF1826 domain-containing protein [Candidatus Thiodiazotropha taylori]PUB87218.1 MAG: DUF1826 domain-containing protein [gamma proteobacterium symbiont of Ctena orbiculata]MBT2989226.1 DUF1826 domain-containing protein [Candidatus Thiodiazotropha taylori]MBT2995563.1 DUF1826 domain-containing protein [Candidatus Thiodiazotropha taylori]MBT3025715.1 DUF1826 domain-containing protein [Candidatus Thiodiazotropha taylori]
MHQILTPQESTTSAPGVTSHIIGDSPDVMRQVLDPSVNLCLWQRPVQPAVIRELSSLHPSDLPDVRCPTSLNSFDDDVSTLLQQQGLDPLAFKNWHVDLRRLADLYFSISENRDVALRLVTTDDDDCRRFHVDYTQLRLLCTYRGPGTEWLANDQVDRLAQSTGAPNDDIIRFGEPSQFEPFWAAIMKGDAYPGNTGHGLVHRSPSIAGSGQTRVLFCLDC